MDCWCKLYFPIISLTVLKKITHTYSGKIKQACERFVKRWCWLSWCHQTIFLCKDQVSKKDIFFHLIIRGLTHQGSHVPFEKSWWNATLLAKERLRMCWSPSHKSWYDSWSVVTVMSLKEFVTLVCERQTFRNVSAMFRWRLLMLCDDSIGRSFSVVVWNWLSNERVCANCEEYQWVKVVVWGLIGFWGWELRKEFAIFTSKACSFGKEDQMTE